ncbi:alpha/beta hydrolase [Pseudonocardia sp. TRM90224]|uniref:alpha/beta hydrolase n=1 Tax=Pseudonocardia sp. TRM90224 TaxID=2812678 RepID=UPI001E43EB51|nr:phospholipase [Pseudonocardia sp. TRM90224]
MNPHLLEPVAAAGAPAGSARAAAVVVHGRDQDPEYMLAVLDRVAVDDVAYLLPRAAGRTWYPGRFTEPEARNQPALDHALAAIEAAVAATGFGLDRTVLVGFSQGACLVTELLLRAPRRFAGAALLTGGFFGPPGYRPGPGGSLEGTPVLLASSRHDAWVPLDRVDETMVVLRDRGAVVDRRVYDDREHRVNDDAVAATRELLTSVR